MELKKLGVKAVHPYAYRWNGFEDKGEITGVYNVKPTDSSEFRICYQITYPDGEVDYTPVSSFADGTYDFIAREQSL